MLSRRVGDFTDLRGEFQVKAMKDASMSARAGWKGRRDSRSQFGDDTFAFQRRGHEVSPILAH